MTEEGRTAVQRRATDAMEAESRAWMARCPKCGAERSVWDMGGIRYKARGSSRWFRRCPNCGKRAWLKIYWKGGVAGASQASPAFVAKLVMAIVLGVVLLTGLILLVVFKLTGAI